MPIDVVPSVLVLFIGKVDDNVVAVTLVIARQVFYFLCVCVTVCYEHSRCWCAAGVADDYVVQL